MGAMKAIATAAIMGDVVLSTGYELRIVRDGDGVAIAGYDGHTRQDLLYVQQSDLREIALAFARAAVA